MPLPVALAAAGGGAGVEGMMIAGAGAGGGAGAGAAAGGSGALMSALKQAMDGIAGVLKKIQETMKKIWEQIKQSSPALQQQVKIFEKSLMVFLRPIGDFFARILRPMAIAVLKMALKWYEIFGGKGVEEGGDPGDAKDRLLSELETATAEGDQVRIDEINAALAEVEQEIPTVWDKIFGALDTVATVLNPTGALIGAAIDKTLDVIDEDLAEVGESVKGFWNNTMVPAWDSLKGSIAGVWEDTIKPAFTAFADSMVEGWEEFKKQWNEAWDAVVASVKAIWTDYMVPAWESVKTWAADIWDTFIVPGFKDVVNWGANIWRIIKDAFKPKTWSPGVASDPVSAATGILDVPTTGIYKLHAGETVLTAGDTSRMNTSSSRNINISNTFNIPTTELDDESKIRKLARKLASLTEIELRRRTAYM